MGGQDKGGIKASFERAKDGLSATISSVCSFSEINRLKCNTKSTLHSEAIRLV